MDKVQIPEAPAPYAGATNSLADLLRRVSFFSSVMRRCILVFFLGPQSRQNELRLFNQFLQVIIPVEVLFFSRGAIQSTCKACTATHLCPGEMEALWDELEASAPTLISEGSADEAAAFAGRTKRPQNPVRLPVARRRCMQRTLAHLIAFDRFYFTVVDKDSRFEHASTAAQTRSPDASSSHASGIASSKVPSSATATASSDGLSAQVPLSPAIATERMLLHSSNSLPKNDPVSFIQSLVARISTARGGVCLSDYFTIFFFSRAIQIQCTIERRHSRTSPVAASSGVSAQLQCIDALRREVQALSSLMELAAGATYARSMLHHSHEFSGMCNTFKDEKDSSLDSKQVDRIALARYSGRHAFPGVTCALQLEKKILFQCAHFEAVSQKMADLPLQRMRAKGLHKSIQKPMPQKRHRSPRPVAHLRHRAPASQLSEVVDLTHDEDHESNAGATLSFHTMGNEDLRPRKQQLQSTLNRHSRQSKLPPWLNGPVQAEVDHLTAAAGKSAFERRSATFNSPGAAFSPARLSVPTAFASASSSPYRTARAYPRKSSSSHIAAPLDPKRRPIAVLGFESSQSVTTSLSSGQPSLQQSTGAVGVENSTAQAKRVCAICHHGPSTGTGHHCLHDTLEEFRPDKSVAEGHSVYVHEMCLEWEPHLYSLNTVSAPDVAAAMLVTDKLVCDICQRPNAGIQCFACPKHFHLCCAIKARCSVDRYDIICPHCSQHGDVLPSLRARYKKQGSFSCTTRLAAVGFDTAALGYRVYEERDIVGERVRFSQGGLWVFGTVIGIEARARGVNCEEANDITDLKVLVRMDGPRTRQRRNVAKKMTFAETLKWLAWIRKPGSVQSSSGPTSNGSISKDAQNVQHHHFGCVYEGCPRTFLTKDAWFDHLLTCSRLVMTDMTHAQEHVPISVHVGGERVQTQGLFREFEKYTTQYVPSSTIQVLRAASTVVRSPSSNDEQSTAAVGTQSSTTKEPIVCQELDTPLFQRNYSVAGLRGLGPWLAECPRNTGAVSDQIPQSCSDHGCCNDIVQRGLRIPLQVFFGQKGWGVRTLVPIPQGSFVCEYIGELLHDEEAESRYAPGSEGGSGVYLLDLDVGSKEDDNYLVVDPARQGNVARFINHSCAPNLQKENVRTTGDLLRVTRPSDGSTQDLPFIRLAFFALRHIYRMEELTWDYGMQGGLERQQCLCGEDNCRAWLN